MGSHLLGRCSRDLVFVKQADAVAPLMDEEEELALGVDSAARL